MTLHETFSEILTSFEYGTGFGWADYGDIFRAFVLLKAVVYALDQWVFGTDYNHIDIVFYGKLLQTFKVVSFDIDVFSTVNCTSIARSNKEFVALFALCNLPS